MPRRRSAAEPSPMYRDLAAYYDRIYTWKKYPSQTVHLVQLARRYGRSPGRRWLDVACGTGRHLEHLRRRYDVVGLDLSPAMLREARRRLPGVKLLQGDMRSFDIGERFDVVSCLFSAIGYLRSDADIFRAFRTFARHLTPGGVLLVEPWLEPSQYIPGHIALDVYQDDTTKIVRGGYSARRGAFARIHFDYLIGESGRGFRHVHEVEELRMVPYGRLRHLAERAGFRVHWVRPRRGARAERGWLVAVAPGDR